LIKDSNLIINNSANPEKNESSIKYNFDNKKKNNLDKNDINYNIENNFDPSFQKSFSSEDVLLDNSNIQIQKAGKTTAEKNLGIFLSDKTNKLGVKNVIIKEKEEQKENSNKVASKNLINILSKNSKVKNDADFSITMTVRDQSEIPLTMEFFNQTKLILDKIEGKYEEKNDASLNKENKIKVINIKEENRIDEKNKDLEESELDNSIRDILQNYKLSLLYINSKENIDKLATLHVNEEEAKKIENFFKNKYSIII